MDYPKSIESFPITEYLDKICDSLKNSKCRSLVLTAETGAGKSTVLPLGLLKHFEGKILMTEPRRIAVLGGANRISSLLEEECGGTVGYKIHLESKSSFKSRLLIMTESVLIRKLQEDSLLEDVSVVVLDEFHERGINLDLALAFIKEAMEVREDLFLIVMSATINAQKISEYLGGAEIYEVPGRTFPVTVEYSDRDLEKEVISEIDAISGGTVLAFLPGIAEIRRSEEYLQDYFKDEPEVEVQILHSSVTLDEQKKALVPCPSGKKRIILSSAIAETSVTIPDVKAVVDSGLCRINKLNLGTGLNQLVTQKESEFNAKQRAGRAGRVQQGRCIRLWSKNEPLVKELEPEILRGDLCSVVLECAERGITDFNKISFLTAPSKSSWNASVFLLKQLGFLDGQNKITKLGKASLMLPLHPRLAGIALSYLPGSLDLVLGYSQYAKSAPEMQKRFLEDLEKRLLGVKGLWVGDRTLRGDGIGGGAAGAGEGASIAGESAGGGESASVARVKIPVLYGFADRVAHKVSDGGSLGGGDPSGAEYQFAMGRKAFLHSSCKTSPEWICAPEVSIGEKKSTIFNFETLEGNEFEAWLQEKSELRDECTFENGKLVRFQKKCFGEIVLEQKKLVPAPEDFARAWVNLIQTQGIKTLPLNEKTQVLLLRAEFYACTQKKAFNIEEIAANAEVWLSPFMSGLTKLTEETVYDALYWYLDGAAIDKNVPEMLILENGRKVKVNYVRTARTEEGLTVRPEIEVIIQRIFGCFTTPKICGFPVLLKLLSPASRPLQITTDLQGFWSGSWIEICKEMKGRYPKHNWDYRVAEE